MKRFLNAFLVIALSMIGANALAAQLDFNVQKVSGQTADKTGSSNGRVGPIQSDK